MTEVTQGATTHDEEGTSPQAWDAVAAGYDKFVAPTEVRLATQALSLAGVGPGVSFLDVAAGCGGLTLPAARSGAKVLATDWSPAMIERFEARVREEGLADADARVMDAHALDLPDDTFDVTGSQFGVMLVPDQPRALLEMVRVTKPGGRVLMIAYGDPSRIDFLSFFSGALQAVVPEFDGLPDDPPPLEFQAADPDVLRRRMVDAGCEDVTIEASTEDLEFRSGQELWNWCLGSNPMAGMLVRELTEEQKATFRQVLDGMLRERSGGNRPAILSGPVNIGVGTKYPGARQDGTPGSDQKP